MSDYVVLKILEFFLIGVVALFLAVGIFGIISNIIYLKYRRNK